ALRREIVAQRHLSMTSLPQPVPGGTKLGLVIDLDICVGCHACAVSCKEWNASGHSAPLTDLQPYEAEPQGVWFNRVHTFEAGGGPRPRLRLDLPCERAPFWRSRRSQLRRLHARTRARRFRFDAGARLSADQQISAAARAQTQCLGLRLATAKTSEAGERGRA